MAGLIRWQAGDNMLAALMLGGLAGTLLLLFLAARGLVWSLRGLRERAGAAWRFGLANLSRRAQASAVQLAGFGLGLMALLLLAVVRVDLLDTWQADLPPDTPNQFALNIQPHEREAFLARLEQAGVAAELYPMLPAPLVRINDQPVNPDAYPEGRAQRLARRAFNLSWSETLPGHNTLSAGQWWRGPGECSVETGIAETLGIALGDRLTFHVAGQEVSAVVTSLRDLQWDSFKVNFFVILSPDLLQAFPATYLTSFYLPPEQESQPSELVRAFPSVTLLDVNSLLGQVRAVMERAVRAVEYVFLLTLAAGVLVLYAALQASQEERLHEGAVLRTLGASRRQIQAMLLAEFLTLGALAGLLASAAANLLGYLLARQVFELAYYFNPWLWLAGIAGGALGIALFGMLGTRRLLHRPPAETLRWVSG
jgi:putative ABC transport system permease protein